MILFWVQNHRWVKEGNRFERIFTCEKGTQQKAPFLARVVRDHHMHMVLWSASAGDWATDDAQLVARRILANARPGAILLLHDGLDGIPTKDRSVLVRALPLIIDGLRAKGLKPVRLDQLLGTAAYQKC